MTINSSGRIENTTTCLPIAYGSIAFYQGPEADEQHTHKWTLYVRSPDQKFDLTKAISKVVFQLHASFPQPTRELTEPPFEITETGWGEFEAQIRIFWNESSDERSTLVNHGIRLYPNRAPATALNPSQFMNTTVPVVSESYDEVVFTNPKAEFHKALLDGHKHRRLSYPLSKEQSVIDHFKVYGDEEEVKLMISAKKFLEGELKNVKDRMIRVDKELEEVKHSLVDNKNVAGGVVADDEVKPKPKIKIKLSSKKKATESQPTAGKKAKII